MFNFFFINFILFLHILKMCDILHERSDVWYGCISDLICACVSLKLIDHTEEVSKRS